MELSAFVLGVGSFEVESLGGRAAGFVAASVVARCRSRGGVAQELLYGREVGTGVEETPA